MSYNYKISSIFTILAVVAIVSALVNPVCLYGVFSVAIGFVGCHLGRLYGDFIDKCAAEHERYSAECDE
jgi:hypothetical protein